MCMLYTQATHGLQMMKPTKQPIFEPTHFTTCFILVSKPTHWFIIFCWKVFKEGEKTNETNNF